MIGRNKIQLIRSSKHYINHILIYEGLVGLSELLFSSVRIKLKSEGSSVISIISDYESPWVLFNNLLSSSNM